MKTFVLALVALLTVALRPAWAAEDYIDEAGYGLLAVAANLGYVPAKLTYAAVGALVGGVAYLVTAADLDAASAVWSPALGGTYLLTSDMLRGQDPIHFAETGTPAAPAPAEEKWSEEPLP